MQNFYVFSLVLFTASVRHLILHMVCAREKRNTFVHGPRGHEQIIKVLKARDLKAGLFNQLGAHAVFRVRALQKPGRRFDKIGILALDQRRQTKLAGQKHTAGFGIVEEAANPAALHVNLAYLFLPGTVPPAQLKAMAGERSPFFREDPAFNGPQKVAAVEPFAMGHVSLPPAVPRPSSARTSCVCSPRTGAARPSESSAF